MASSDAFKNLFAARLIKEWTNVKVTDDRIQLMWYSLKHLPDEILERCARTIVARNQYFPGADKCIATSLEVLKEHQKKTAPAKETKEKSCLCGGTGVRCVDNYAFQCPCPAGKLNYPNCPMYTGQAPFVERRHDNEDAVIIETRNGFITRDKHTGKSGFLAKDDPWKEHRTSYSKDEFGLEKRIPESLK